MLQVLLNIVIFGMEPQTAVEMPRFATHSFPNSFYPHEYLPKRLCVEESISDSHRRDLEEKGHEVVRWPALDFHAGAVCCIIRDQDTGVLTAAADPRRESAAVAR
jgi:gamma-glutamyltranspeptidase/glutathione hydrolase